MKVYVQWTTDPAQDWVEIDSSEWNALPKRPVPTGGEVIDDQPGWVWSINCQGLMLQGFDHYAVADIGDETMMAGWRDDDQDPSFDDFVAKVWFFKDPAPDPGIGGRPNTVQRQLIFHGDIIGQKWSGVTLQRTVLDVFDNFAIPGQSRRYSELNQNQLAALYQNRDEIRHGINVSEELMQAHIDAQTLHGWREWII